MGLTLLVPLFAAGLAAVAIPILVHLVHRERKDTVPFPSLMFLRRVPYRHSRRRKLRDWLLFALRALAVALLALAFARPVIARSTARGDTGVGGREVVLLLDRSLSMRLGDRWSRATTEARRVIAGVGVRDRLTLVPFDLAANAVNEPTGNATTLGAALDTVRTVDAGTRLGPAIAVARRLLGTSTKPSREVVLISDFQRSAFDLTEDARLGAGMTLTPIDVGEGEVTDRAVRAVELRRLVTAGRELVGVTARVSNAGPAARAVEARLIVEGRVLERKRLDLPRDGGGVVTFAPVPAPGISQRAEVHLTEDGFPASDGFNFVFERTPVVSVLLVEASEAPGERGVFLSRALEIGDQPPFDLVMRRANRVTGADIAGRQVVVLHDAWLPSAAASRLGDAVRAGAGLLVATGERSGTGAHPGAEALLPAAVAAPVDRAGERGAVLGYVDAAHPALALFGATRSGDLSAARFFRYRPVTAESGVMARLDDGSAILAERRVGRGRVLQFGSSFDGLWNDLPRQPVFLPFVHQLVRYAADYRERRSAFSVGEAVDVAVAGDTAQQASRVARVAESPSGVRTRYGGDGEPAAFVPREAGVYAIRRSGAPGERAQLIAVNVDSRELDFARFDPARLTAALAPGPADSSDVAGAEELAPRDREREQSLWWYLLLTTAAVLVGEAMLAGRLTLARRGAA